MSVGRPWTVKFKETSIEVVKSVLGFIVIIIKGVGEAFLGAFSGK